MGFSRVGCMPCINASKEEIRQIARLFPERIEMVREWERQVQIQSKQNKIVHFFRVDKTPLGAKTGNPNVATIDHVVQWARTTRGGNVDQFSFGFDDEIFSCMSALGACE
ncbi:MAG: hypothetical protein HQM06_13410 [Magnetococcales bacterium]|nr:hypothetical protein [Magnetococcales bacterium]